MKESGPIKELFNQGPKLISASAKSPAGVISLMMLILAVVGYAFFAGASESAKVGMFMLMFIGYFILSLSVLRSSSQLSRRRGTSIPVAGVPDSSVLTGVSLRSSFKRLSLIWGTGSGLVFLLLLIQYLFGKYREENVLDVWAWVGPTIIPPVSVVVIGFACSFWDNRDRVKPVLTICSWLSVLYLSVALATILIEPFVQLTSWVRTTKFACSSCPP